MVGLLVWQGVDAGDAVATALMTRLATPIDIPFSALGTGRGYDAKVQMQEGLKGVIESISKLQVAKIRAGEAI